MRRLNPASYDLARALFLLSLIAIVLTDLVPPAFAANEAPATDSQSDLSDLYIATGKVAPADDWSTEAILHPSFGDGVEAAFNETVDGGAALGSVVSVLGALEPTSSADQLHAKNEEILRSLINIMRLNTSFRMESTKQPPLRQWRQSAYVETNSGCTLAGTIDGMRLNYPNIHRPATIFSLDKKVSLKGVVTEQLTSKLADPRRIRPALSQGIQEPQVVGNCVNICGDIYELAANDRRWKQLKQMGLDTKTYRHNLLAMSAELDAKLADRDLFVQGLGPATPEAQVAHCEGVLQRDLRDLLLEEYGQYHSSATRLHWFQNAAYLLDLAKNTTGAAGGIVSIEGNHIHRPKWGGSAALLTTISGTLILIIPLAGRVAGNWAGTVDRHIVNRDYGQTIAQNTSDAFRDRAALIQAINKTDATAQSSAEKDDVLRLYAYSQLCDIQRGHEVNIQRLLSRAKSATVENVIYGTTIGSTKVALGVCGMIAGWHYSAAPWMASRLQAAGNTAYAAGTSFSIGENARVLINQQLTHYRLQGEQLLPGQIYRGRLDTLDIVEHRLNEAKAAK